MKGYMMPGWAVFADAVKAGYVPAALVLVKKRGTRRSGRVLYWVRVFGDLAPGELHGVLAQAYRLALRDAWRQGGK